MTRAIVTFGCAECAEAVAHLEAAEVTYGGQHLHAYLHPWSAFVLSNTHAQVQRERRRRRDAKRAERRRARRLERAGRSLRDEFVRRWAPRWRLVTDFRSPLAWVVPS